MVAVSRRSFLERLSFGAGAFFLTPIVNGLLSEARGATAARKRFLLVVSGNGWTPPFGNETYFTGTAWPAKEYIQNAVGFTPPELKEGALLKQKGVPLDAIFSAPARDFTLAPAMSALAPLKERLLLVDGLTNRQWIASGGLGAGHSQGYATFSCTPNVGMDHDGGGTPGGITFDQYLANTLGKDSTFKSINLATIGTGIDGSDSRRLLGGLSATGAGSPVQAYCLPKEAFMRVFAGVKTGATASDPRTDAIFNARKSVMDFVAADVGRVQARLAPGERRKMDEYLSSIRALERRLTARVDISDACQPRAAVDAPAVEDRQEAQMDIAVTALLCGITQVAMVALAAGPTPNWVTRYVKLGAADRIHTVTHGDEPWGKTDATKALVNKIHNFHAGLVAKAAARLDRIREGDRSVLDGGLVMWTNDAGAFHHCSFDRYPLVLLGTAGGKLKVDGRYLRYPLQFASKVPPNVRSIADLFCTVAHALGAPIDDFGKAGKAPVKGPLGSEITV